MYNSKRRVIILSTAIIIALLVVIVFLVLDRKGNMIKSKTGFELSEGMKIEEYEAGGLPGFRNHLEVRVHLMNSTAIDKAVDDFSTILANNGVEIPLESYEQSFKSAYDTASLVPNPSSRVYINNGEYKGGLVTILICYENNGADAYLYIYFDKE
ncbi:MAG TPA: hypothetical protein PK567_01260 [Bacillota bacterium]|nr:hypothetical protein [Bacillota bacterium]